MRNSLLVAAVFALGFATGGDSADHTTAEDILRGCGFRPEAVRDHGSIQSEDFEGFATVSAVTDHDENIVIGDHLTQLALHGTEGDWEQRRGEVYAEVFHIAARAARCGAAYGVVAGK